MILEGRTSFDCEPTLTSSQVVDFCRNGAELHYSPCPHPTRRVHALTDCCPPGYILFEGVVPEAVNARCFDFLDAHAERCSTPGTAEHAANVLEGRTPREGEPIELLQEPWFVEAVLLCPAVLGAVRTLLGPDFGLPAALGNHRIPLDGVGEAQAWHHVRALPLLPLPLPLPASDLLVTKGLVAGRRGAFRAGGGGAAGDVLPAGHAQGRGANRGSTHAIAQLRLG